LQDEEEIMIRIEKGYDSLPKLIGFLNKAFHHHFRSLLPKIYKHKSCLQNHFIAKEDGVMVGALGCFPILYKMKDLDLRIFGIGMVATAKKHRGRGIMSSLVKASTEYAKANGGDIMVLTGQRQRYEHFGFVPAGSEYKFMIREKNLQNADASHYTFEKVRKDSRFLPAMEALYNRTEVHAVREVFFETLISWYVRGIYAVLKDGAFVGYIVSQFWNIHEIVLDNQDVRGVLKAFMKKKRCKMLNVKANPMDYGAAATYFTFAERCSVQNNMNIKVIDYENLIRKLLLFRMSLDSSYCYKRLITINTIGTFDIEAGGGKVNITRTEQNGQQGMTESEAITRLFTVAGGAFGDLICPICLPHIDNV
jgi:predicted N-acetyltransferase YhbS